MIKAMTTANAKLAAGAVLIIVLSSVGSVWGQAFRASGGGTRSSGATIGGGSMSRSLQQTPRAIRSVPRHQSRGFRAFRGGSQTSSGSRFGHSHGHRLPSHSFKNAPALRVHSHPKHFHHHKHRFHRHIPKCGVLIIEVPSVVGTTVTTPPDARAGQRFQESPPVSPESIPGRSPGHLAPFDPTPEEVVERMLELAGVKRGDVLYDLGSGDGRVVIAAAKKYGVKAVGFEIDPGLVKLARENVRKENLEKLVEIREQDFMTADLSPATVVTLYLSFDGNLKVRPLLMRQLKPGARVVSYHFDMGDWQPKIVEAYRDSLGEIHTLYYWQISGPFVFSEAGQ